MNIIDRRTKLKARRAFRIRRRHAENIVTEADQQVERLFLKRFDRLVRVKRFVAVWVIFTLMLSMGAFWQARGLSSFYLTVAPTSGGTYREGILGTFTTSNPLFATGQVDSSVSVLLYSGLFKQAPDGELIGDLATKLEIDEVGRTYTVHLREDVSWHDGEPFDADDVVFTYQAIQDPNVRSSIRNDWLGVKVSKVSDYAVRFDLPSTLASFEHSLINGIVPKHVLEPVEKTDLRSSAFNTTQPVGTGPFTLRLLEVAGSDAVTRQERIVLNRNADYHGGLVQLDSIVLRSYRTQDAMLTDFDNQVIQSMVGLTSVSENLISQDNIRLINRPLTSSVMVFFNNSTSILSDKKVRQALVHATDTSAIRRSLGFEAVASDSPFLKSQFAYNSDITQLSYNRERAVELLDAAGWELRDNGIRYKEDRPLQLRFVSQSLSEYALITQKLQEDWRELGVEVDAILQPEEDIQAGAIAQHDYDVLLYGIAIGYDPDVFAYWHSSQADVNAPNRLNLSEFDSAVADEALEEGRTRIDEELRNVKYEPFLKTWRDEAPAIALYQPRFLMVVRGTFDGFIEGQLSKAVNRYFSVADWRVRNTQVIK